VLTAVQGLNWIQADMAGVAELTAAGRRVAALATHEQRSRAALLDYIDVARPPWVQAAARGRAPVRAFAGVAIAQVLDEAGLMDGADDATVAFWDALAARARGLRNDRLTEIGRSGERLSIAYERQRTGREPKWTAIENNADGYDVLSVVGPSDPRFLSIEVKASTVPGGGEFHLTANEWRRATEAEAHLFHLWRLNGEVGPRLTVVSPEQVASHIPANQGHGSWESTSIPFAVFDLQ
jgi:hypothetical protein